MVLFTQLLPFLAIFCANFAGIVSTPIPGGSQAKQECDSIEIRREWRDLTVEQRLDYLRAVKCLQETPANIETSRKEIKTRYDQFQAAHFDLAFQVHGVGQFLAWHRHFVTLYHKALRDDCGYEGPATYWDWTRDADGPGLFKDSPVFDDVTGFGGNGVPGTSEPLPPIPAPGLPPLPGFPEGPRAPAGCVQTGPFKDHLVNFGPGQSIGAPSCIIRAIYEDVRDNVNSTSVAAQMAQTNFEDFRNFLELQGPPLAVGAGLHWAGHAIVGGMMMDGWSAPGDPLFYLHHGNLDRIWYKWQMDDPENRLYAISGPSSVRPPSNDNVTRDFMMPYATVSEPVAVGDVMDTEAYPGCFKYVD
ncbi:tyrosinase central domain-containing protein [Coprinopsis cinerea okayama7|uniref:Tyrosinase central domain-containing protein n=1 Tax=Coprinopsis cinerea (strain Okayama-7 / 130 / ATCC MYA-4618 / FGSC 9003) TaxID=240176 RepID=A8N4N8_COPC7|nr:tyrosinase central domain-containing protein [Coprinopsis cinerea okayama7\|eukprot:XP_001829807.1 tyrosinase central domain-containing protein [Coprinopsis cinerea okayama7\